MVDRPNSADLGYSALPRPEDEVLLLAPKGLIKKSSVIAV